MGQMVGDQVRRPFKPEIGNLAEHLAFARNRIGQHHVESRKPVSGYHQQPVLIESKDIADFAAMEQGQAGQIRGMQGAGHEGFRSEVDGVPL